jgi:hypothetical protein
MEFADQGEYAYLYPMVDGHLRIPPKDAEVTLAFLVAAKRDTWESGKSDSGSKLKGSYQWFWPKSAENRELNF